MYIMYMLEQNELKMAGKRGGQKLMSGDRGFLALFVCFVKVQNKIRANLGKGGGVKCDNLQAYPQLL